MSREAPRRLWEREAEEPGQRGKGRKGAQEHEGHCREDGSDPSRALEEVGVHGHEGGGKEGGLVVEGSKHKS